MRNLFFYGTLRHLPHLAAVLGREAAAEPARIADHALFRAADGNWPVLSPQPGASAEGIVLRDASAEDLARISFYEAVFGWQPQDMQVDVGGETISAICWVPEAAVQTAGPWVLEHWVADHAAVAVATAGDVMALMGQRSPAEIGRRYRLMQVRGASRLRAQDWPATRRRAAVAGDVAVARRMQPYANFFAVEEYDLQFRRFDGRMSETINRAVFLSGDAVTVLPYDRQRDRVLLIEQFRAGPYGRGDPNCWSLEAIAGRVDPDETPEQAARREAVEEAGLQLGALEPTVHYYPSPGAKAEYLFNYIALCDLPDGIEGVFGQADEAEDIRGHLVPYDEVMAMVASGEIQNGPLLVTLFWLQANRERLRG